MNFPPDENISLSIEQCTFMVNFKGGGGGGGGNLPEYLSKVKTTKDDIEVSH